MNHSVCKEVGGEKTNLRRNMLVRGKLFLHISLRAKTTDEKKRGGAIFLEE